MHCLVIGRFQQLSEACGVQVSPFKDWIGHMIECGKVTDVGVAFLDRVFCGRHALKRGTALVPSCFCLEYSMRARWCRGSRARGGWKSEGWVTRGRDLGWLGRPVGANLSLAW